MLANEAGMGYIVEPPEVTEMKGCKPIFHVSPKNQWCKGSLKTTLQVVWPQNIKPAHKMTAARPAVTEKWTT